MSKCPKCPFLNKSCIEHDCVMYMHLTWVNPQTGQEEDKFQCAFVVTPMLMLENARKVGGVQSAVESMRNEVVQRQDTLNAAISAASQGRLEVRDEKFVGSGDGGGPPRLR